MIQFQELAYYLQLTHSIVYCYLKIIGNVSKLRKWIPHEWSKQHLLQRINTCSSLQSRFKYETLLKSVITRDESENLYNNLNAIDNDYMLKNTTTATKTRASPKKCFIVSVVRF